MFEVQSSFPDGSDSTLFNEYGDHRNMTNYHDLYFFDEETFKEDTLDDVIVFLLSYNNVSTKINRIDYSLLQLLFNLLPINLI